MPDSSLREDAATILTKGDALLSDVDARRLLGEIDQGAGPLYPHVERGSWPRELEVELQLAENPIPSLEKLIAEHNTMRLYRVRPTRKFRARHALWRMITDAQERGVGIADTHNR